MKYLGKILSKFIKMYSMTSLFFSRIDSIFPGYFGLFFYILGICFFRSEIYLLTYLKFWGIIESIGGGSLCLKPIGFGFIQMMFKRV